MLVTDQALLKSTKNNLKRLCPLPSHEVAGHQLEIYIYNTFKCHVKTWLTVVDALQGETGTPINTTIWRKIKQKIFYYVFLKEKRNWNEPLPINILWRKGVFEIGLLGSVTCSLFHHFFFSFYAPCFIASIWIKGCSKTVNARKKIKEIWYFSFNL